jgi:hypothetical protein
MLHEPYCMRMNKFCETCQNAVEIAEFENHLASHTKTEKKEIEKNTDINLNNNLGTSKITTNIISKDNLKRLESAKINCEFCELLLCQSEYYDHTSNCGARSTLCEYCNKKFLVKQLKPHLESCSAKIALESDMFYDDPMDDMAAINKLLMEEDERLAKQLAKDTTSSEVKDDHDLELAKRMQMELDERLARE